MFYDARKKNDHGLPHDPFKAIVAPRPIGWITSMSAKGEINLAPYSYFNSSRHPRPDLRCAAPRAVERIISAPSRVPLSECLAEVGPGRYGSREGNAPGDASVGQQAIAACPMRATCC